MSTHEIDFDRIRSALVAPLPVRPRTGGCEAMHFTSEQIGKLVVEWCKQPPHVGWLGQRGHVDGRVFSIAVRVGAGSQKTAYPGDWIIRDHWGHFDVLSAEDFEAEYEPA